jgi:hypothetical protein
MTQMTSNGASLSTIATGLRPSEHAPEHRGLDPVVERGPGAVRADEIDIRTVDAGLGQRRAHGPLDTATLRREGRLHFASAMRSADALLESYDGIVIVTTYF